MAGKKVSIDTKVSGSTLMEVLVAMILLLIVFSVAMMIFANIARSSVNSQQILARAVAELELQRTKREKLFTPDQIPVDSLIIIRDVQFPAEQPGMVAISIRAADKQNKTLAEIKEQLRIDETE